MKVTLSWLREFAPLTGSAAEIGEAMDDLGMAVEELVPLAFDGIVVARVLETRPHPSADRIQLVDVDTGDGEALQICCGAFNMAAGDLVPLATLGTTMPNGMEIARRKMRGEWSNGMLCSAAEIGLGADAAGIMVLPGDLDLGQPLVDALGLRDDALFDLEINPNRPDAMSVAGVARDLAARLGVPFSIPRPAVEENDRPVTEAASVAIVDADLCGRFVARVVRGVTVGGSPLATRLRLTLAGMRPINSIVDASNYVMLELGAPNHAYDLSLVPGGALRVRRARAGERIVTLDDVERTVAEGDGLICDRDDRPIGIAGVMGGANTEIGPTTSDVLIEAAWWDPPSISRTARRLSLRSEASARFERGTDPELLVTAADRFAELLGASVDAGVIDERGDLPDRPPVRVRAARVNAILGTDLAAERMAELLAPIGFAPTAAPDGLDVEIPSWRYDSAEEIDVIEEIARHHGYSRIRRTVPRSPYPGRLSDYQADRRRVRSVLVGLGFDEAMPLPLLGPDTHLEAGLDGEPVRLLNALTSEESTLRSSLRPGLLRAAGYNVAHRASDVRLFELGHVFLASDRRAELPDEREHVAVLAVGEEAPVAVRVVEALLSAIAVPGASVVAVDDLPGLHPTRGAVVRVGEEDVGLVGEIHPSVAERFEIGSRVAVAELRLDRLLALPHGDRSYAAVSLYPSSDLDLAFVVPEAVPAADVLATLREAGGAELVTVALFDVYRGAPIGEGARSLAFRLRYQAADRTLTESELAELRTAAITAVVTAHGAALR